jgi:RNA polymerase sigma-70 factor (ECF subfamily)
MKNNTVKYNKSEIMKNAWVILRTQNLSWSNCLKQAWKVAKTNANKPTFDKVYNAHYAQILNYISFRINNKIADAEEITQDVFMQVHKHLATYDSNKSAIVTWVYNIAHVDGFTNSEGKSSFDFEGSVYNSNDIEVKETQTAINEAINTLKDKEQKIAMFYFLEEKPYAEIAELMCIPLGSVKGTLSRIRVKLQDKLQSTYADIA